MCNFSCDLSSAKWRKSPRTLLFWREGRGGNWSRRRITEKGFLSHHIILFFFLFLFSLLTCLSRSLSHSLCFFLISLLVQEKNKENLLQLWQKKRLDLLEHKWFGDEATIVSHVDEKGQERQFKVVNPIGQRGQVVTIGESTLPHITQEETVTSYWKAYRCWRKDEGKKKWSKQERRDRKMKMKEDHLFETYVLTKGRYRSLLKLDAGAKREYSWKKKRERERRRAPLGRVKRPTKRKRMWKKKEKKKKKKREKEEFFENKEKEKEEEEEKEKEKKEEEEDGAEEKDEEEEDEEDEEDEEEQQQQQKLEQFLRDSWGVEFSSTAQDVNKCNWNSLIRKKRFSKKQKMYSTIANELLTKARVVWERAKEVHHEEIGMTKELPPILLVWGDGTFPATSRSGPIANDGLKDHLAPFFNECVWGIEYGTTKYSPCCKTPLLKKKERCPKGK